MQKDMNHNFFLGEWQPPVIKDGNTIQKGDMPGDKIQISTKHIEKANKIFKPLLEQLFPFLNAPPYRSVISVYGGSGVGKSEIGSLLAHYLSCMNINSYVLSGDNYPHRIPSANDAERLRIFRESGLKGFVASGEYTRERHKKIQELQDRGRDSDGSLTSDFTWLSFYQNAGRTGLSEYLGTLKEIDFDEVNRIIEQFKEGSDRIPLKRMGREEKELWYEFCDVSQTNVLVIEWTHGNNENLKGVDIPIFLNSTPQETREHRKSRNRDGAVDSPFTTMVLELEQNKLFSQAERAKIIVLRRGDIISYAKYRDMMSSQAGPMLNAYPDSLGGTLSDITELLSESELKDVFQSFYILPSVFHTDLDRGFSVIEYELNDQVATKEDLGVLQDLGIDVKFDFILNHASVLSKQFQDIIRNGEKSVYKDFFINWNTFWEGHGVMTEGGYIQPDEDRIKDMFFRKPGLPILNVRMPDGREVPYWNTFYQEVRYPRVDAQNLMTELQVQYPLADTLAKRINEALDRGILPGEIDLQEFGEYRDHILDLLESEKKYLGQMDLNIKSPLVWDFYKETLGKLKEYGARIVRLDAFAYAPKEPGEKNFLNDPGTWDLLEKVRDLADSFNLTLLPEIHSKYEEKIHEKISEMGYMTYDFFLPGLIIDAFERKSTTVLRQWIGDIQMKGMQTVNMLGCHDGIPLLDLKGLLSDKQIKSLIDVVVSRGGYVKDLHGKKNIYYQVNATYFSALGEDEKKMLLARAIQIFMPGKPQIWYLDLFAGKNNYEAVKKAGAGGHKEINRTNLTKNEIREALKKKVVHDQITLLKFRKTFPAFGFDAELTVLDNDETKLNLIWDYEGYRASLRADLLTCNFEVEALDNKGDTVFHFNQDML